MTETSQIVLRTARREDCRFVWLTNNHPTVREQAINTDVIAWESHQVWFEKTLKDPMSVLLVVMSNNERVGVVRFDLEPEKQRAVVTIALVPECRGQGIGRATIRKASKYFLGKHEVDRVSAYIRPSNLPSIRAFEASGFIKYGEELLDGELLERFELIGDERD